MAVGPQDPHSLPWGSLMVEWWQLCPPGPPGGSPEKSDWVLLQLQEEASSLCLGRGVEQAG